MFAQIASLGLSINKPRVRCELSLYGRKPSFEIHLLCTQSGKQRFLKYSLDPFKYKNDYKPHYFMKAIIAK